MIQKREEMKDNRGFSLVELIIVIAIMAILVAVLAPQFLKYVESSRNSADVNNAKEITNVIAAAAADAGSNTDAWTESKTKITVTGGSSGKAEVTDNGGTNDIHTTVEKALTDSQMVLANIKCKSRSNWTSYVVYVEVDSKGELKFTYGDDDDFKAYFQ